MQTEDRARVQARAGMRGDDIVAMLMKLSVDGLRMAEMLPETPAGRHIGGQMVRSVTACGANYEEARAGESRRDFVHKLAIAHKEAHESRYWVRLIHASRQVEPAVSAQMLQQLESICRILGKSLGTARSRLPPR